MLKTKKLSLTKKILTWTINGKPQEVISFPMEKINSGEKLTIDAKEINLTLEKINDLIKALKTNISFFNNSVKKTRTDSFRAILSKFENIVNELNKLEGFYDQKLDFKKITLSADNYFLCRLYLSDAYWKYGQNNSGAFDIMPIDRDDNDVPFNILLILLHAHHLVNIKDMALRLLDSLSTKEKKELTELVFSKNTDQYNLAAQLSQKIYHINDNAQNLLLELASIKRSAKYLAHKFRFNLVTLQTLDQRLTEKLNKYFTINLVLHDRDKKNRSPVGYLVTTLSLSAALLFNSICGKSGDNSAEETARPDAAKATLVIDKSEVPEIEKTPPVEPKQRTEYTYETVTETRTKKVPYQEKVLVPVYKEVDYGIDEVTGRRVIRKEQVGTEEKTITKHKEVPYTVEVRKKVIKK